MRWFKNIAVGVAGYVGIVGGVFGIGVSRGIIAVSHGASEAALQALNWKASEDVLMAAIIGGFFAACVIVINVMGYFMERAEPAYHEAWITRLRAVLITMAGVPLVGLYEIVTVMMGKQANEALSEFRWVAFFIVAMSGLIIYGSTRKKEPESETPALDQ
jgi:hypothetical protein